MNVSADLRNLQQLESSASQTELVQAIHVKKRFPTKNTKRQCHFKQHWKDDYPWVEHGQHVLQGMQITLYVFCCFFYACLFVTIGFHNQEIEWSLCMTIDRQFAFQPYSNFLNFAP